MAFLWGSVAGKIDSSGLQSTQQNFFCPSPPMKGKLIEGIS